MDPSQDSNKSLITFNYFYCESPILIQRKGAKFDRRMLSNE